MKIFISSPQVSLEEYRKAIKVSLEELGFDDIFLSEYHGSRSQSPIEVCMENIEKCEIFILLLGNKYGTIPMRIPINLPEN